MILIGFMGSGKSTIAERLYLEGYTYVDTDVWIEERCHTTIPEIFDKKGEQYFRALEYKALASVLNTYRVISNGGGIITYQKSYDFLKETTQPVVWLDAPIDILLNRIKGDSNRPLAQSEEAIINRYLSRESTYRELADIRIDTTESFESCVKQLINILNNVY